MVLVHLRSMFFLEGWCGLQVHDRQSYPHRSLCGHHHEQGETCGLPEKWCQTCIFSPADRGVGYSVLRLLRHGPGCIPHNSCKCFACFGPTGSWRKNSLADSTLDADRVNSPSKILVQVLLERHKYTKSDIS